MISVKEATPQNFPNVNDYRNPVVAEALKVLGFVNRFSRGVLKVKTELKENGNSSPTFSLDLITAFLAEVFLSTYAKKYFEGKEDRNEGIKDRNEGKESRNEGIKDRNEGIKDRNEGKEGRNEGKEGRNEGKEGRNEGIKGKEQLYPDLSLSHRNILNILKTHPQLTYTELADNIGVSDSTIWRLISQLKADGYLKRERGNKSGFWIILK